jgi:hypothetical protein
LPLVPSIMEMEAEGADDQLEASAPAAPSQTVQGNHKIGAGEGKGEGIARDEI